MIPWVAPAQTAYSLNGLIKGGLVVSRRRQIIWGVPTVLYALFVLWYTDFGGPLQRAEINSYIAVMKDRGFSAEMQSRFTGFMESDTGSQFLMLNAIDMAENPPFVDEKTAGETADQLMARYMDHMYAQLFKRACHPVIVGDAVHTVLDIDGIEGAEEWDMGALFRYRSRRTFMDVVTSLGSPGPHEYKMAAVEKTIAYPIEPFLYLADLRLLLGLVLFALAAMLDLIFGRGRSITDQRRGAGNVL